MDQETSEKERGNSRASSPTDAAAASKDKSGGLLGRRTKYIVILLPIILIVAGYFIYQHYFEYRESTDDAQIDGHVNPVAAKVSGQVISINVKDNQYVKAGTVIVQIDPRDYQVALEKAEADLAAARSVAEAAKMQVPVTSTTTSSQVSLADAGVEQAEAAKSVATRDVNAAHARLDSAQARLREAEAAYTKASQDLERMELLITKDEVSKQQYDAAVAAAASEKAARDSAQAGVEEARRAIDVAQARVSQADARIKEAQANLRASQTAPHQQAISRSNAQMALARVKQVQATLDQARLNLGYTDVKAPIDGIISQRKVELGQYVQTGQPLLAIVPLHNVWVTANFKENQLENMRPGQKATVTVDAYGGREYRGHVDSIAAATGARFSLLPPENATGNYVKVVQRVPVKIIMDTEDTEHPLRPGLSVIATVITREDQVTEADSPVSK
jgi:membrane fusion protein (multidrug efflux system)